MRYSDDYFREIQTLLEAKDQIIKELKEENLKLKEENEKLKEEKERLKADLGRLIDKINKTIEIVDYKE
jgi:predicted RNase H-like nuclease (RuvC/YqgF family)